MGRSYTLAALCVAAWTLAGTAGYCCPAEPGIRDYMQPDGTVIKVVVKGDENFHWLETPDGKPLVMDTKTRRLSRATSAPRPSAARPRKSAPNRTMPTTGTVQVPVILVNFNDRTTSYGTSDFESLLFGTSGRTMRTYYSEVSCNTFTVTGAVAGWYTAAKGHDYYGQNSAIYPYYDLYPATLVIEAVKAADAAGFNFAPYDLDHNGYVDSLLVVHQGTGEEANGSLETDIWSHRWDLYSAQASGDGTGPVTTNDGVIVNDYAMMPEIYNGGLTTVGVFCHEFGHILGLPDLYDTDYSSQGIGIWSLMASGSWGGISSGGDCPTHPDAWCKAKLGWLTPTVQTTTVYGASIPQNEGNAFAYKLWATGSSGPQYFLIENRQKTGFDQALPGAGLCIWHVDDNQSTNNNEWYPGHTTSGHYHVALEQADGLWEMEHNTDWGDNGDPYPGSTSNRLFNNTSVPDCKPYAGTDGLFSVRNISGSSSTMTADIVFGEPYVADGMVRGHGESDSYFLGNDIINSDGTYQTKTLYAEAGATAVFDVRVQNDGFNADTFKVTGPAGGSGWTVTYYDALTGGNNITSSVTGSGWTTPSLTQGSTYDLRVVVSPDSTLADGETKDLLIVATSVGDGTKSDTVKASTVKGYEAKIGTGTSSGVFPMGTYFHDERTQVIYLASEIGKAGIIKSLALDVSTIPGQMLTNWTIRMKHTSLSSYSLAPSWESSGWTVVYQANTTVRTTGWCVFNFTTPFTYNGTDNLMVDFSFNNTSYTTDGECRYTTDTSFRTLYLQTDSAYGDPLTWSGTSPAGGRSKSVPNLVLGMQTSYSVAGQVTYSGSGLSGVTVATTGGSATTNSSGNYSINSLSPGTYTVTPTKSGYLFVPTSRDATVGPSVTGIDFVADVVVTLEAPVMSPEPEYTLGDSNSVSWSAVNGATQYEVERSTTSDFSADVVSSDWQTGTSYTFTGLTPGTKYYYRARGCYVGATTQPGPWSEVVFSTQVASTTLTYLGDTDKMQNEVITLKARLTSGATNLVGLPVAFVVDSFCGCATTDGTGVATVQIPANRLQPGTWPVYGWFLGNSSYAGSRCQNVLAVHAVPSGGYVVLGQGWFEKSSRYRCVFKLRYDSGLVAGALEYTDLRGGTQIVSQICSSVVLSESNDVATITGMCSVNGGALQSFTLTVRASTNEFTLVTSGYSVGPKSATGGDILIGQGL